MSDVYSKTKMGWVRLSVIIDDEEGRVATATVTVFQPRNVNDFLQGSSE